MSFPTANRKRNYCYHVHQNTFYWPKESSFGQNNRFWPKQSVSDQLLVLAKIRFLKTGLFVFGVSVKNLYWSTATRKYPTWPYLALGGLVRPCLTHFRALWGLVGYL